MYLSNLQLKYHHFYNYYYTFTCFIIINYMNQINKMRSYLKILKIYFTILNMKLIYKKTIKKISI